MKPRILFPLLVSWSLLCLPTVLISGEQAESERPTDKSSSNAPENVVRGAPKVRGEGKNREMLLCGRVLDLDGVPARDFDVVAKLNKHHLGKDVLWTKVEGSAFEVWVPIGGSGWSYLELAATPKNGNSRVFKGITNCELRQAAIEGVDLRLRPTDRVVEVAVMYKGAAVANAHVAAALPGHIVLQSTTDANGKSVFRLSDGEKLSMLTAWTDDFRIGGYWFEGRPRRDPRGTEFSIDLDDCRNQTIRLIDEGGSPVPNVSFWLEIGAEKPNFNFVASPTTFPHCRMITDKDGEAIFRWFPDWESHNTYAEIMDPHWARAMDNGALKTDDNGILVMTLKQRTSRKPIVGKIVSDHIGTGGLLVEIKSFQSEEENRSDHVYAFAEESGNFTADIIPGASYTVCVNDGQLVSNMIDLIPYEPETGKSNVAELKISEGKQIEIRSTSGSSWQPMRNQRVNVRQSHRYTWMEDGKERGGHGARDYAVFTDDHGVARALAPAGAKMSIGIYADDWRSEERELTVKDDGITSVEFHRKVDEARDVRGQLIAPVNDGAAVAGAEIVFGSIDGETDERQTIAADKEGRFSFKTRAIQLGIFAYTTDGKAAGVARPEHLDDLIEIQLNPTSDLHGQLIGKNNEPLAHHAVRVWARVSGKEDFNKSLATSFEAKSFETKTDEEGNYTLDNLPSELDMTLQADPTGERYDVFLDSFYLIAGQERPRMVSRFDRTSKVDERDLSSKHDDTVRVAKLDNYHVLVLSYESTSNDFVNTKLLNRNEIREVSSFLNLHIEEDLLIKEADRKFAESRNWLPPAQGKVFVCALDGTGQELGRIELDIDGAYAAGAGAEFIRRYTPPQADAKMKWDAAFAEAKRSDRRVWARIGQRYCAPCFRFSSWLDDNRELLEQDYVLLKIDDVRDKHGVEIANRIVNNRERYGVPFHAIFDANEGLLIDSQSPVGNIGYPSSFEDRRHLIKMLRETRRNLSMSQIDQVLATLKD